MTDYELDRIAKRALKVFFGLSTSSSSSSCTSLPAGSTEQFRDENENENDDVDGESVEYKSCSVFRPDLPEAFLRASNLGRSGQSSSSTATTTTCKFSYLSGAAVVCYGVPGLCV